MAQYLTDIAFEEIRDLLAKAFLDKTDAVLIARNSGLNLPKIGFSDKAINTWDEVLSQAEIETKLVNLLSSASRHGGGISEIDKFRSEVETGILFDGNVLQDQLLESLHVVDAVPVMLLMYDNSDSAECNQLKDQLYFFEMNEELVIKTFEKDIVDGDVKKQQQEMVLQADIIVPVISPKFFNPANGFLHYLRSITESAINSEKNKKMVPVLLVNCLYARVKVLKDYLTLPPFGKFVDDYPNKQLAYKEVAEGFGKLLDLLKN